MISCLIHTYNEERNIARCLKSLYFADEIVIVDMGSTDKTLSIASSFQTKIYSHPYTGYVEPARNFGIKKAIGDWIVIIDADEVIPENLMKEIIVITGRKNNPFDYYRIPRKNIIFNKWIRNSGWWPDYQIRLFKKGYVNWAEKIHGIPITKGNGSELPKEESLAIVHYNYSSLSQFIERMNRYTSIQAREINSKKEKISFSEFILRPTNEFVKRFFMHEGYKDGIHGFALSSLQALSELVVVLKVWEENGFVEKSLKLEEYGKIENQSHKIKNYWLVNELIKYSQSKFWKFYLKVRRKMLS